MILWDFEGQESNEPSSQVTSGRLQKEYPYFYKKLLQGLYSYACS